VIEQQAPVLLDQRSSFVEPAPQFSLCLRGHGFRRVIRHRADRHDGQERHGRKEPVRER
jgi:hypothetical protein